jgi:tRNA pseudouridine38-40 synthase
LSYAGTNYSGWQVQPNGISVQQVINEKMSLKLGEEIEVTGAGRTDTGVHAEFFVAHFDSHVKVSDEFISEINSFLPSDIVFHNIQKVIPEAHARFSAISRTYQYRITRKKNPFLNDFSYYYHSQLDISEMNRAAAILKKVSDFTSFSKLHSSSKTNICKLTQAEWKEESDLLVFTISADRFLRNMVRAIVGTLMDVGKGKLSIKDFKDIIEHKNRSKASSSAQAKGLFLTHIEYPENIYVK